MNIEPKVSFLIINYNGLQHLKECFDTLKKLNYPKEKLEFIMVDNGSNDSSIEFIKSNYSYVKIIKNNTNQGFAKPNNDAAKIATGEYIALINNDMKIDSEWLNDMLQSLCSCNDDSYVCAGSKILNWDGSKLDFAGGSVSFYGHGYQYDYGMEIEKANKKYNKDRDILFACGGAMLVKREIYMQAGGLDEDYFAYFEDVDFGWRLWILGYKVRFCSKALCNHKHNSTSKKMNKTKVNIMFDRNSLYTIYKNYGEDKVYNITTSAILLKTFKGTKTTNELSELDKGSEIIAINEFLMNLPKIKIKREFIQKNRKRSDEDILKKFIDEPYKNLLIGCKDYTYNQNITNLVNSMNLDNYFGKPKFEILIICNDRIASKMAGPAIRYFEMAKQLSEVCNVTLAIPNKTDLDISKFDFRLVIYDIKSPQSLLNSFMETDIVLIQGMILKHIQVLNDLCKDKIVIVDLYDPFTIENLEIHKEKDIKYREETHQIDLDTLKNQLKIGDYFICANEKQKDLWIGMLSVLNKVNPNEYDLSSNLEKLIGIVPFGMPENDAVLSKGVYESKIPNYNENDKILIWGGGIWNWFDPLTLIEAIAIISRTRNDIKLFFMGIKQPNTNVPEMEMTAKAIKLAEELGIKDKQVFFNMDWVNYEERQNYLLESYAGVSCHFNNLETRFSFRTRILDYLWCKLPIISTEGDYFAEEITKNTLGLVVKYKDPISLSEAIIKLSDENQFYNQCVDNIIRYRSKLKWNIVTQPLKEFCMKPVKKRSSTFDETYDYITDIKQQNKDELLGPLYEDTIISQEFKCRYPNLVTVDIMVGTYQKSNNHSIIFKLYEYGKNIVLANEKVDASLLADNSWLSINFKPIINSEGRKFYFTIEAKGTSVANCITFFKNPLEKRYGKLSVNNNIIIGCIAFRTQCIYSQYEIEDSKGIILSDNFDNRNMISDTNFNSDDDVKNLVKMLIENDSKNSNKAKEELNGMQESIEKLSTNLYEISNWKNAMDSRFKILKGFSFIKNIFK